jgi:hypothetical protein
MAALVVTRIVRVVIIGNRQTLGGALLAYRGGFHAADIDITNIALLVVRLFRFWRLLDVFGGCWRLDLLLEGLPLV